MKKRIYFAAPLFCAAEVKFNDFVVKKLEDAGYSVFLPQRDGVLAAQMQGKTRSELVATVFARDRGELEKSDILVFVLDGRVPDEGACVELGIAHALKKPCFGLRTDARALEAALPVNPMIEGCFTAMAENSDAEAAVAELIEKIKTV